MPTIKSYLIKFQNKIANAKAAAEAVVVGDVA